MTSPAGAVRATGEAAGRHLRTAGQCQQGGQRQREGGAFGESPHGDEELCGSDPHCIGGRAGQNVELPAFIVHPDEWLERLEFGWKRHHIAGLRPGELPAHMRAIGKLAPHMCAARCNRFGWRQRLAQVGRRKHRAAVRRSQVSAVTHLRGQGWATLAAIIGAP